MPARAENPQWRKANRSIGNGACVEVAKVGPDQMGVRDSKRPEAGHLAVATDVFRGFTQAIKGGSFDLPRQPKP